MKKDLNPVQYEDKMLEQLNDAINDDNEKIKIQAKMGLETYRDNLKDEVYLSKIKIRELIELNTTADNIYNSLKFIKYILIIILMVVVFIIFK